MTRKPQLDFELNSKALAREAREEILRMTHYAKASHVGSSLSVVDILAVLYSGVANISPNQTEDDDRDIVILSKGHAATALYSILALRQFFPRDWLRRYCEDGAELSGHVTRAYVPGVELSTGSLGHGLPYGIGIQISRKLNGVAGKSFIVMSDGECNEGTTWESALLANHHNLESLVVIVDRNRIQSMGHTEETLSLEPFDSKWKAFDWNVYTINGHDHMQLASALNNQSNGKPTCIIANTIKGYGVDFMENSILWHYKPPSDDDLKKALFQIASENN